LFEECSLSKFKGIRVKIPDIDIEKPTTVAKSRAAREVERKSDRVVGSTIDQALARAMGHGHPRGERHLVPGLQYR